MVHLQITWNTEYCSEFVIPYTGGKNMIPPNTNINTHTHVCTQTQIHTQTPTHTNTHIHTRTLTHTQTHTQRILQHSITYLYGSILTTSGEQIQKCSLTRAYIVNMTYLVILPYVRARIQLH